jgi:Tim17/Tim22/Tim23/Pmp24 family
MLLSLQLLPAQFAAASTFSGRTIIASASIHRPRSSSLSSSSTLYNSCFTRPRNGQRSNSRNQENHGPRTTNSRSRRSPFDQSKCPSLGSYDELCDSLQQLEKDTSSRSSSQVILASSRSRTTAVAPRSSSASSSKKGRGSDETVVDRQQPEGEGSGGVSYDDLTPLGRCVYGSVEVAIVSLTDFVSGCFGGYMIGVVTDIPRLLFRSVEQQQGAANLLQRQASSSSLSSFWSQVSSRMVRMHGKSWRWGKEWGTISAVFGASRVATKVVRGGKEDEWSTVFSSMAAGAYFARKGTW